ncbi:hypothetical protein ACLB2K_045141 [Fragaria x ananassa]
MLEPFVAHATEVYELEVEKKKKKGEEAPHLRIMLKKNWMVGIGVVVASVILVLSLIEMVMGCKKQPWRLNNRFRWRRASWILGVYGVLIAIIEIVFYTVAFNTSASLHIALFACVCMRVFID